MWPMPRAPISSTRNRVAGSARSTVYGWPSSLLNEPAGATVGPSRRQQLGDEVLGGGLAGRAGDADDRGARAAGRPRWRERPSRRQAVATTTRARRPARASYRRDRARARSRPRRSRARRPARPANATNSPPGPTAPRVELDAAGRPDRPGPHRRSSPPTTRRRSRPASSGSCDLRQPVPPSARAARDDSTRSSNGCTTAGDLLAALVALAGRATMSPGAARRTASAIAAPPVADLDHLGRAAAGAPRRAASIARRIAAGSSVRGLSSVTMSTSALRAAAAPMTGRLPGPGRRRAPSTHISRPGRRVAAARAMRRSIASGLWA